MQEFIDNTRKVPKSGLHNAVIKNKLIIFFRWIKLKLKNPERYTMYGDIFFKIA